MGAILGFIALAVIWVVIQFAFKGAVSGAKAAYNAATGKDSFSDSFKTEFSGMGKFETRVIRSSRKLDELEIDIFEVQARGIIPVTIDQTDCAIYTHVFDITDQKHYPVISAMDEFSETNSKVYQHICKLGPVHLESGYKNWVTMSVVIIDAISLAYSGLRELLFQSSVVPTNNPPTFDMGYRIGETGQIYAVSKSNIQFQNDNTGYMESILNRKEVEEIIIELGFHIAASDGQLSPEEGTVIKEWASDILASSNLDNNENKKERLNKAITASFERANNGQIDLGNLLDRLNDIATVQEKYEAIELCLDVMKADHIVDENELKQINIIAKKMEIDPDRFRALQDRRLVEVKHIDTTTYSIALILDITPEMSKDDIRKHLALEYRKWNSRVSSEDENVRTKANEMLIHIANARKHYLSAENN